MTTSTTRGPLRRSARFLLAGALSLAAVHGAAADDNGLDTFFSSIFGGGAPQQAAPPPVAVTTARALPRITVVPVNTIVTRSASGASPASTIRSCRWTPAA